MSDLHEYREYPKYDARKIPRSFDHLTELRLSVPEQQKDKIVVRLSAPDPRHVRPKFKEPPPPEVKVPTGELPKEMQDWLAAKAKPDPRKITPKFQEPPLPEYKHRGSEPIQNAAVAALAKPKKVYPRFQEPPPPMYKRYTREPSNAHFYETLAKPNPHKISDYALKKQQSPSMTTTLPSKPISASSSAPASVTSPKAAPIASPKAQSEESSSAPAESPEGTATAQAQ